MTEEKSKNNWIVALPEHWRTDKLKYHATIKNSNVDKKSYPDEIQVLLCNYVDVYYNEKLNNSLNYMKATATLDEIMNFSLLIGDVIITKDSESFDDIAIPAFVIETSENLVCGYHLTLIRPNGTSLSGGYLVRCFQSQFMKVQFESRATGVTRFGLPKSAITNCNIPIPPLPEQRSIAAFLDRETTRIDTLIDKKQKLIALLKEKRTALITRAVTKGLNPKAKMKDSGIQWLGEIPAHWEVKRLKFLVKEKLQYGANEAAEYENRELPRYIRITDIDEDGKLFDGTFRSIDDIIAKPYLLMDGDVLFARSGATVGKTFLYEESIGKAAFAGYLICARLNKKVALPKFIFLFSKSSVYYQWINSLTIQATIQNVSAEKYNNLSIGIPNIQEQVEIVNFLEMKMEQIDSLIFKVTTAIEKLREYRTALISAAVTGKVRVSED